MRERQAGERILTWSSLCAATEVGSRKCWRATSVRSGKEHVILAYLTYLAIGYLWTENRFRIRCLTTWTAPETGLGAGRDCHLAMLKHLSTKPQLSGGGRKEAHTPFLAFTKQGLLCLLQGSAEHLTEGFQIGDRMFIEEPESGGKGDDSSDKRRRNMEERTDAQYVSGHFCERVSAVLRREMEYYLTFTNRQVRKTEVKPSP